MEDHTYSGAPVGHRTEQARRPKRRGIPDVRILFFVVLGAFMAYAIYQATKYRPFEFMLVARPDGLARVAVFQEPSAAEWFHGEVFEGSPGSLRRAFGLHDSFWQEVERQGGTLLAESTHVMTMADDAPSRFLWGRVKGGPQGGQRVLFLMDYVRIERR